ncbi:MAG: hypothetical protein M3259_09205, partial [Actinomycetota bacterium]|nr:hypothetical protein [Actinomycetota bacterium]
MMRLNGLPPSLASPTDGMLLYRVRYDPIPEFWERTRRLSEARLEKNQKTCAHRGLDDSSVLGNYCLVDDFLFLATNKKRAGR